MTSRRVPDSRVTKRVDLALTTPARSIELRYRLSGITARSTPVGGRPCADRYQSAGRRCSQDSSSCDAGPRRHRAQHRVSHDPESARTGVLDRPLTHLRVKGNLPVSDAVIVVQFDLPMPQ